MAKKKSTGDWLTHHTIHIAIFAIFVGFLVGMYSSFFFFQSDWKPAVLYRDEVDHDHDDMTAHTDEDMAHDTGTHSHDMYMYMGENPPSVTIDVRKDTLGGYNLELLTTNFEFTPLAAGSDNVEGQGHAHLYINGEKITRLYGNHYYLGNFDPGTYQISVTLNTNDHFDYSVNGEIVSDEFLLKVE